MSENKHVFEIVPGKQLGTALEMYKGNKSGNVIRELPDIEYGNPIDKPRITEAAFIPLYDKSGEILKLPVKFCTNVGQHSAASDIVKCIEEREGDLKAQSYSCKWKEELSKYDTNCTIYGQRHKHVVDHVNDENSFVYLNDELVNITSQRFAAREPQSPHQLYWPPFLLVQPAKYQYITRDESGKYYFSDREGNIIDSPDNEVLQKSIAPCSREEAKEIISNVLSNISDYILSSNVFIKFLVKGLSDEQLKTFTNTINDKQLQAIAKYLTDDQLQALVDHFTNHQLETLAQELNETKLKIIVPTLNEDQLGSLVRGLEPDQVKNLLPHLKMDQFKVFITSLDYEQFTVIVKDLAEHHLTILSKELGVDQLRALVSSLQEDQLKDLVNKLDDRQLVAIAQDLTDPSRIKVIIDSLIDPEKLQILAQNMSDEQFAKLLNELSPKDLKDIIHKLPYEKVISVVGNLGSKDQSNAIIEMLKEKLGEQSEKLKEILDKVDQMRPEESEKIFESVPNISSQGSNDELMEAMTYVQYQPEYL
ncbi:magnesium transporter MgtE N-terminal domain-containing protein [Wolbachia pipientis]|uniref:magnesium transporter MgtE N-terminal domain-containing protein n=1 Tax=Wolbachia pipientis TaxID=955 RepID=UPI00202EEA3F|nr:MgtE intracellular N domain protein [Wolbachia pipientis]MCM1002647.1 MgtE intracellular N domain protein [Wolbachia pipientis]